MKKTILYSLIFVFTISSCLQPDRKKLSKNQSIKEIFTENEIETLNEILIFFDNYIVIWTETLFIDSAYHRYSESLVYNNSNEEFWSKLKVDNIENEEFLETIMKTNVFNELWSIEFNTNYETKDTIGTNLIPNLNGKYMKLLDLICKDNSVLLSYKKSLLESGGIPPSLVAGFPNIHSTLDFSDEKTRLFVALHYMTIKTELQMP